MTQPTQPIAAPPPPYEDGPNRLTQTAAWVGIVAGAVFVVTVIFFSGFITARYHSGDGYGSGCYHGGPGMMDPGTIGPGGMMGPGGAYGPGPMMGPGGLMGPWQQPSTSLPPPSPSPRP